MKLTKAIILFLISTTLFSGNIYKDSINPIGMHMSEKLDGIRGNWNGKELVTKRGNKINAPKWFIKNFPPFRVEGELFTKRNDFENIQSIVLDKKPTIKWKEITYNIFYNSKKAKSWFWKYPNKYVKIINQIKCQSKEHLNKFHQDILLKGGEGVMIKDTNKVYKLKKYQDLEAKVININKGKGKFKDMMGSLTLKLENGVRFKVGSGFLIEERLNPPKVGTIVTIKHYGFTKNGKPKFASFMRVRKDFNE